MQSCAIMIGYTRQQKWQNICDEKWLFPVKNDMETTWNLTRYLISTHVGFFLKFPCDFWCFQKQEWNDRKRQKATFCAEN